jgi:hypothetical protein
MAHQPRLQDRIQGAAQHLKAELAKSMKEGNWRQRSEYFSDGIKLPRGSVNLSPAWFQQGHDVSLTLNSCSPPADR